MSDRITIDPEICRGKSPVRSLQLLVFTVIELPDSGMTWEEILTDYPGLEAADIQACLTFAVQLSQFKIQPLAA